MMSVASKYQQASFRGVKFLIRGESETRGKKVVIHEYPNSNKRFIEEMGSLPSSFSMQAFVHGARAFDDSDDLIRALDAPGIGVLIHPIYGRLEVKSTTYERSTTETEFGEIVFDIKFESSQANISLSPIISTTASVTSAADAARASGFTALKAAMIISKARQALITTQRIATTAMQIASGNFKSLNGADPSGLSAFDRVFKTSLRNLYQASVEAEMFADTFQNFYNAARAIINPAAQRPAWQAMIGHEVTRTRGPTNTAIRLAAETNTEAINSHTRVNALINLFESLAYTQYSTDAELNEAQALLNDTFEDLFSSTDSDPITSDRDLRESVLALRNVTNDVLNESSKNVFKIQEIIPGETSVPLLVYQYYGSLDALETIQELNPGVNWMEVTVRDTLKAVQ